MNHTYSDIAARQLGLVTRRQLTELGTTRSAVGHLLATGRLESVRRGVYRVAGAPEHWRQRVLAACLALGVTARASYRTAAALVAFDGFPCHGIEITVAPGHRSRQPGIIVHESNCDRPGHRSIIDGIPTTSVARTLADLSWILPPWRVGQLLDDAIRRRLVTLAAYERVARDLSAQGRRRSTVTRAVLDERVPGHEPGESAGEQRIARLLVAAGLPRPVAQHHVRVRGRTYRVDLAYPEAMLAIEYDGWEYHRGRSAFDRDRARANDLEVIGFTVLRFTSSSPDATVVDTVRAVLGRRSAG
jgi:hypothetical protein